MKSITAVLYYCITRLKRGFFGFFEGWYKDGTSFFIAFFFSVIKRIDRVLALKITIRYFFTPLYNDRTFLGYILGVVLRSGRILVAVPIYLFVTIGMLSLTLVWMLVPIFFVYKIVTTAV